MSEPLTIPSTYESIPPPPVTARAPKAVNNADKVACPDCGNYYTVTASTGQIRGHNCPGVLSVPAGSPPTGSTKGTRATRGRTAGKKTQKTPPRVRHFGSALIGAGAEWTASQMFARAVPCDSSDVPSDLPDDPGAEGMVGPFLDLLWPQIPAGGQKFLTNLAEQEDLILACIAWYSWFTGIKQWAEQIQKANAENARPSQPTLGVVPDVIAQATQPAEFGSFEPFQPVVGDFATG